MSTRKQPRSFLETSTHPPSQRRCVIKTKNFPHIIDENNRYQFIASPFGLCCIRPDCSRQRQQVEPNERMIQHHLHLHAKTINEYSMTLVRKILSVFCEVQAKARAIGNLDSFCEDNQVYKHYRCSCDPRNHFKRKDNANRHCMRKGCDVAKLTTEYVLKLCCGRYVSQFEVDSFFGDASLCDTIGSDYSFTWKLIEPFLPELEKRDKTYTHMYFPLVENCRVHGISFVDKIKSDYLLINSPPTENEQFLATISDRAVTWLRERAQMDILRTPGNFRAYLQTFDGQELHDVNHRFVYTMQHEPERLIPDLLKLLSFAYRKHIFERFVFDTSNDYAVAIFLKDLLLETTIGSSHHPFLIEFCLMSPFRVKDEKISMISCDTFSSLFSRVLSVCKAAVCSVIISYRTTNAFELYCEKLVEKVRKGYVIHTICPMLRQVREMSARIPRKRKTTLDPCVGDIVVDQFRFPFDIWSRIVPLTIQKMKVAVSTLADGIWWEPVIDMASDVCVGVDASTGDLRLTGINVRWKDSASFQLDVFDAFKAQLEMAFHGFGGGAARYNELSQPTMHHCLFVNHAIYYSLMSIKVFNHASSKFKFVERKLPPVIGRFFLLYRSVIQVHSSVLFKKSDPNLIFPERDVSPSSKVSVRHIIQDLFLFERLPDMTQVRHFWAGVSNFISGNEMSSNVMTSNQFGASKFGHSSSTHAMTYSSKCVGSDETHFKLYHLAIGDTISYNVKKDVALSLFQIRKVMSIRYPNSKSFDGTLKFYSSLPQKELVEFSYGSFGASSIRHCLALLAPGEGKSECYLIPCIARAMANIGSRCIIHISPYNFLASYQYANAKRSLQKVGINPDINCLFTGSNIYEGPGGLPQELSSAMFLPSILFLTVDAIHNLFMFHEENLRSWVDYIDKIVIDEIHTVFSEMAFRPAYNVFSRLPTLGVPIVGLSGSMPLFAIKAFAERFCLSTLDEPIKIIHGGDITGDFPIGFKMKCIITSLYFTKVIDFVIRALAKRCGAIHVFVAEKWLGEKLFQELEKNFKGNTYRFVSSDTKQDDVNVVSSDWGSGKIDVLITTTIGLVGNENPSCRFLCVAGYLYDCMQIVQAIGRLRKYMRIPEGEILFTAPIDLPSLRLEEDAHHYTNLKNQGLLDETDKKAFSLVMTSKGVQDWYNIMNLGVSTCAMKQLSLLFGKKRDNCGTCPFCRLEAKKVTCQSVAQKRLVTSRKELIATLTVIQKLAELCVVCGSSACGGLPFFGTSSCWGRNMCFQCGVSRHKSNVCFDRSMLQSKTCYDCWVMKGVPGATIHEKGKCPLLGRLRRLLSYHYEKSKTQKSYQQYLEGIYCSDESFCRFLTILGELYIHNK